MKCRLLYIILSFLAALPAYSQPKGSHSLKFRINGLADTVCYLATYYGPKQYYKDTATVDAKGNFKFEGKEPLPGGIYSVIFGDKKTYFEFLVNEQKFYMETDTADLLWNMKIKGSEENTLFYGYRRYISKKNDEIQLLKHALENAKNKKDSTAVKQEIEDINLKVREYKIDIINNKSETLLAKIFKTSADPDVPEAPLLENGKKDPTFEFRYFKAHYLDEVDFSDDRLLRTPVLHNKIKYYIKQLTMQIPDSINTAADLLVEKARANKEVFKYVVHYITNTYEKSKIMGMDAVFVHMAENYYMKNEAYWMDSTQLAKLRERAMKLKPLLIGNIAPNLILQDTTGKWHTLHQVKARYTVLFIWDPDCGHCKKETPKLITLYEKYREKDVEVFAVSSELSNKLWKKYLIENKLDWINVSDTPDYPSNFRSVYDVYSTPIIYLLNAKKEILAKRLSVEQLEDFLEREFEKDEDK